MLTGEIPAELGGLANLRTLHLGGNGLTGPIPPQLGSLSDLQVMGLNSNQLTGAIPAELGGTPCFARSNYPSNDLRPVVGGGVDEG